MGRSWTVAAVLAVIAVVVVGIANNHEGGWDKDTIMLLLREYSIWLGYWAVPLYIVIHTLTLALCLPYAVFFEAGASLLFGFLPGLFCVFAAKVLGASLSFWIGRLVFRRSKAAMEWARRSRYFSPISKGVERDGWKFVLLARFSPLPSYVVNYALAATDVGFVVDFLLPTAVGCLPMILQNVSIGSIAGAAVTSTATTTSPASQVLSYAFPLLGIVSSVLISWRLKKYSSSPLVVADR